MKRRFTDVEEQQIAADYLAGNSVEVLARKYATDTTMIQRAIKRCGVPFRQRGSLTARGLEQMREVRQRTRRYQFNEGFFDSIDTPAKARWLGFIAADGCLEKGHRTKRLGFALCRKDAGHLAAFAAALAYPGPIVHCLNRDGESSAQHPACRLALNSAKLFASLEKQGIHPRKSLTLAPWDGPQELQRFWLAGYFDGDGGLCRSSDAKRQDWRIYVAGTRSVLERFQALFATVGSFPAVRQQQSNCCTISTGGSRVAVALARCFYGDLQGSIPLHRKFLLAQELL